MFARSHGNCYQKNNIEFMSCPSIFQTYKKGSKDEIKNLIKVKLDRNCNGKERLSLTTMENVLITKEVMKFLGTVYIVIFVTY